MCGVGTCGLTLAGEDDVPNKVFMSPDPSSTPRHVVIVCGGFGGLNAARSLIRAPVRVMPMIKKNAGKDHCRRSPWRLAAAWAWDGIAGYVYRERFSVERFFGHQATCGGGLGPLPAWVSDTRTRSLVGWR